MCKKRRNQEINISHLGTFLTTGVAWPSFVIEIKSKLFDLHDFKLGRANVYRTLYGAGAAIPCR
jgi:hypothetical protein